MKQQTITPRVTGCAAVCAIRVDPLVMQKRGSVGMKEAIERVREHMKRKYRVDLDDLVISDVPGYWKDKEPKMHKGHPLHRCLGCDGPFCATYTYLDHPRDYTTGKFASPYRTWRILHNKEVSGGCSTSAELAGSEGDG
jgi:hypothetical protein